MSPEAVLTVGPQRALRPTFRTGERDRLRCGMARDGVVMYLM